jgi:hypothetical protein
VRVEVTALIDRPVADVFRWYADEHVRNHPRWDPDIELAHDSGGPVRVGTVLRRRNSRYGTPVEGTMEVVEYEPERALGAIVHEGGFEMTGRATFAARGDDATTLTLSTDVPDSLDRELIQARMQRSARTIKELVESDLR